MRRWSRHASSNSCLRKPYRTRSSCQLGRFLDPLSCAIVQIHPFRWRIFCCDFAKTCRPSHEFPIVSFEVDIARLSRCLECAGELVWCSISYQVDLKKILCLCKKFSTFIIFWIYQCNRRWFHIRSASRCTQELCQLVLMKNFFDKAWQSD